MRGFATQKVKRLAAFCCLVFFVLLFAASFVHADNCGSPADCQTVPGNVDAATGLAAIAAGTVLFVVIMNRRRATANDDDETDDDEDWQDEDTSDDDNDGGDDGTDTPPASGDDDDGLPPPPIPERMRAPLEPGLPPPPVPGWIKERWRRDADAAKRTAETARKRADELARLAQAARDRANSIPREPAPDDGGLPPLLPEDVEAARAEELARQAQQKADELDADAQSKWELADPLCGQQTPTSCGIASARMVIEALTGQSVSESALRTQSQNYPGGWDPTNGTRTSNLSDLLKANGVDNVSGVKSGQSLGDLTNATQGGHPAIVHFNNPNGGGHFMVVDGVQTNPDGSQSYLVRDPWPPGQGTRRVMSAQDMANRGFHGEMITTN